jgi:hypothetical protein
MKKLIFLVYFISFLSFSQNKEVLYDFAGLPQTLMLNPGAEVNNKFYFGFPLFSQIAIQSGFTAFSAYDVIANNGIDINTKIASIVQNYGKAEFVEINEQLEVLSGGFKLNETMYLSFGYYQELDVLAKIPKNVVDLVYAGNTTINREYSINKLSARAELLGVLHGGISKKVNDKWQAGARLKIYSGVLNASSKLNKGSISTVLGINNTYNQQLRNIDVLVQTSGVILEDYDSISSSYYVKKFLFGGNLGLGIDLGFTHHFKEQWTVSGSLQDIGFIYNTHDTESYSAKGSFDVDGFDLNFSNQNPEHYWDNLVDEFEDSIVIDTIYSNYISTRPLKINGAVNYSFGKKLDGCRFDLRPGLFSNKFGLQVYSTLGSVHSYVAATLFYERWFNKHFQAKFTYTVDSFSFSNLGVGVSTQFAPFNLYILADNLLYLNNIYAAKSASIQIGINFIFYDKL